MKTLIRIGFFVQILIASYSYGQIDMNNKTAKEPRVQWLFSAEAGGMFHKTHIGKTLGFRAGAQFFNRHLSVSLFYYGRSGPINNQTFPLQLESGSSYKGKSVLNLGADHGAFGVEIAPQFQIANSRFSIDVPLSFGQIGAGFYLKGEDRQTPDGRRVSEWENELMGNNDAGFGLLLEGGLRVRWSPLKSNMIQLGVGAYYSHTIGWKSFIGGDNFYKVPRATFFVFFGN